MHESGFLARLEYTLRCLLAFAYGQHGLEQHPNRLKKGKQFVHVSTNTSDVLHAQFVIDVTCSQTHE